MNDKFAADIRNHLLQSADERPADGQLDALLSAVAGTSQHHPLVARLSWLPDRIGPHLAAPVRYGLIGVALLLAAMAGGLLASGGAGPSTVFEGTWTSTDPADGSAQFLVVGAGNMPEVYYEDGYASGAACVDDAVKRFVARGTGVIAGNHLDTDFPDGGGCGLITVGVVGSYDHRSATDTLVDQHGVTWNRTLTADSVATDAPATDPPATDGPETDAPATDTPATDAPATDSPATDAPESTPPTPPTPPHSGETFTSAIHGISIDYPSGWTTTPATQPWNGDPEAFGSPSVPDVLVDPASDSRLILLIASAPYGGLTQDEWRNRQLEAICRDGYAAGDTRVDGVDSLEFMCANSHGALIMAAERGYLIRFLDRGDGALLDTYDVEWFRAILESVDLRPEDAVDPDLVSP